MRNLGSPLRALGVVVAAGLVVLLAIDISIRLELIGHLYCGVREAHTPSR